MKVLLINGSPHEKGCTYTALSRVAQTLNQRDIDTEILHIGSGSIPGCTACSGCSRTKRCVFDDAVNQAIEKAEGADGLVFGTPVYFSSPAGSMVSFMDRMFNAGSFYHKPAAVVASARRGGCTSALDVLLKYPTYQQMPLVSGDYWPIVYGNTPEEVLRDEEGIFTMETVGRNMAWLLRCIEAGRNAGAQPETVKKEIWTNFIR
ncbi:MAG: flavodoxin family protein [Emergencia sp.]|nr:flavodoxin family protein [Emergencia sp.]